jgi:hypothetical protein
MTPQVRHQAIKLLFIMPILASGCASQTASLTSDFTVGANSLSLPVHVSGATLGASTATLEGLVKQSAECGIRRSGVATASALEGRNLSMQWAVNGLIQPGLSSVTLRLQADGLADHVDVQRISLQISPSTGYVREMCEMTTNALLAMREKAAPRSASSQ